MPPRYDGAVDPSAFLMVYEEAILKAGGDDKVMANWLPVALTGAPRAWLLNLPGSTVTSWGNSAISSLRATWHRRTTRPRPY